jgi:hypothetical protein
VGALPDFTTFCDDCAIAGEVEAAFFKTRELYFSCTSNDLLVTVFGDNGTGMFMETAIPEFPVTANQAQIGESVQGGPYTAIRIMVKPASPGANGALSTNVLFIN